LSSPVPSTSGAGGTSTQVRYKRHVRNYILDKKLQLRYVLVVTLISAALAATLGFLLNRQETYATNIIIRSLSGMDYPDEVKQEVIKGLHQQDRSQMTIMLVVGLGMLLVLSGYLVLMTHKVAGPLFKISLYFDRMRDGKLPKVYELRKGDQLRDFFDKFREMDEALRERTEQEIALYEKVLAECEKSGVPSAGELGHRLDELRALVKERQASLT
jgi:hypothetical protein